MELRGSKRLELFFEPKNVADMYLCNLDLIGEKDYNLALKNKAWLKEVKIPLVKDVLDEELKKEFGPDTTEYAEQKAKLEKYFHIYENAIDGRLDRLEFLKSYA